MGSIEKIERYTAEQPDGTVITTITTTKTLQNTSYLEPRRNLRHIVRKGSFFPVFICKIFEIVIGLLIVGCCFAAPFNITLTPFHGIMAGQNFVIAQAALCCISTGCLLIVVSLLRKQGGKILKSICVVHCWLAAILHLIGAALEAYYSSGVWQRDCNGFMMGNWYNCPVYSGPAAASVFCFINCISYGAEYWLLTQAFKETEEYSVN